eukprot:3725171-Rhodomonas_salina.1
MECAIPAAPISLSERSRLASSFRLRSAVSISRIPMSPTMLLPISRTVIRGQRALSDFTTAGELSSPIPFAETRSCLRVVGYALSAFARTLPPRAAIQFPLRSRCASCLHCRRQTVSQGTNWPISSRLQLMSRNVNAVHVPTNALAPVPVMSLACSLRLAPAQP